MTYREFLTKLPTLEEKILFEMRCFSQSVIKNMFYFPRDSRFFTIKLEDISHDRSMKSLYEAFSFLGFSGQELTSCLKLASKHCLWNIGKSSISTHATSGISNEWEDLFIGQLEHEFRKLFGWTEKSLGY